MRGEISGAGPTDPQQRAAMLANGWQPYSVKIGDTWYSYRRLDPFASILGPTADLVELASDGRIAEPRSGLGRYLVRHWEHVSLARGESLVYWLRKLVFRGAWLDHRVKEGLLEVAWDEDASEFVYLDPRGDRALLELLPVPSWHDMQFRR